MEQFYRLRALSAKRLKREAWEQHSPTIDYFAKPILNNLHLWHFTFRGTVGTEFEGGYYHGCIIFPYDYPLSPPSIQFLNPNGRFQLHEKFFFNNSDDHTESWLPSCNIETILLSIIASMSIREKKVLLVLLIIRLKNVKF